MRRNRVYLNMASPMKKRKPGAGRPKLSDSARKRKTHEKNVATSKRKVYIGLEKDRWDEIKVQIGLKTDVEVAKLLIDAYKCMEAKEQQSTSKALRHMHPYMTSTPSRLKGSESESMKSSLSGIEPMSSSDMDDEQSRLTKETFMESQNKRVPAGFSASFVDPFDVSIDIYQDETSSTDSDSDQDYEPSFDVTIGPCSSDNMEEISFADEVYGFAEEEDSGDETFNIDDVLVERIVTEDQAIKSIDHSIHLCYKDALKKLAKFKPPEYCSKDECNCLVAIEDKSVGSALYFNWVCTSGHCNGTWCSQPVMRRGLHAGDLLTSAAILFSGNNYQKVQLMTKFMKLPIVSSSSFLRIQRQYLVPAIENVWQEHQDNRIKTIKDTSNEVVIAGDGRMDSPGHCAQYCTYTAMVESTNEILSVVTIDKRETGKSSVRMEKEGFLRTLIFFQNKNVTVKEVITDAHPSITATQRKEHSDIKHSYDIWHAAKNLAKKIMKAAQQKQCGPLKQWCSHIVNHFYYICGTSSSVEDFTNLWFGVLHHVVDEHVWIVGRGGCSHGPLTEPHEIQWLEKDSPPHNALRVIVADKRFLKNIPYFLNARSTADLEGFNSLITMYAGKRFSYTPPVYRARNILAALDHNHHLNRNSQKNKDGTTRMAKVFNKKSNRWSVRELKTQKTYSHIDSLLKKVFSLRGLDKTGMNRRAVLSEDDPRRLSATIAPVLPAPKDVLIQEHKSRLSK